MAELLSHVRNMDLWELFHSMFTFLCMLLDSKMAKEAGECVSGLMYMMTVCCAEGFTSVSEELRVACLKLLKELLLCSVTRYDM